MTEQLAEVIQFRQPRRLRRIADRIRWAIDHSFGMVYAKLGFTPNGTTQLGVPVCVAFSLLWTLYPRHPAYFWIGLGGFLFGALHDGFDGSVARLRPERRKPSGSEVDSNCDRVVEMFMYAAIAKVLADQGHTGYAYITIVAAVGSFMISHLRARAELKGIDGEVGWAPREVRLPLLGALLVLGHFHVLFDIGPWMALMAGFVWVNAGWRYFHLTLSLDEKGWEGVE